MTIYQPDSDIRPTGEEAGEFVATSVVTCTYVVPLRCDVPGDQPHEHPELAAYLRALARNVDELIVVDGSETAVAAQHRDEFGPSVRVERPTMTTRNGKVGGVITGVRIARNEAVVIADDDVRYDLDRLAAVIGHLREADVVRPQNYFDPLPWHARFDTARTLLNRATTGDWPGTLAVRRSTFLRAGCYRGDVLFENLELVRTIAAAGGTEHLARDVLVARRPPPTRHFVSQQVRQAYDEFARPLRLALSLLVLPGLVAVARRARPRWHRVALSSCVGVVVMAETGRRRAAGARVYPATSSLLAPLWVLWRSAGSWVALGAWLRGGARYRGSRLRVAASPPNGLRRAQSLPL